MFLLRISLSSFEDVQSSLTSLDCNRKGVRNMGELCFLFPHTTSLSSGVFIYHQIRIPHPHTRRHSPHIFRGSALCCRFRCCCLVYTPPSLYLAGRPSVRSAYYYPQPPSSLSLRRAPARAAPTTAGASAQLVDSAGRGDSYVQLRWPWIV